MKKKLLVLLLAVVALCVVLASCKEPEQRCADGEHVFNLGTLTKAATCSEDGSRLYACLLCGYEKTVTIPATGEHAFGDYVDTKQPTCGTPGEKTRTCADCGTTDTAAILPTGDHTLTAPVVQSEAGCAVWGISIRSCTNEGCTYETELPIPATNKHVASETYQTTDTTHYNVCIYCDMVMNEKKHTWSEGVVTKPVDGCKSGLQVSTCTVCKKTDEVALPSSEPHTSVGTIDKEANKVTYACTKCGEGYFYNLKQLHDMEEDETGDHVPFKFISGSGAEYKDTTQIRNVVKEEDGNFYQELVMQESSGSQVQVQNNGTMPGGFESFVLAFDIRAAKAVNTTATFDLQFYHNEGAWADNTRGIKFLSINAKTVRTSSGTKLGDLSDTEWSNVRMEVTRTEAKFTVRYYFNQQFVAEVSYDNTLIKHTFTSIYWGGNLTSNDVGFHFDNILVGTND